MGCGAEGGGRGRWRPSRGDPALSNSADAPPAPPSPPAHPSPPPHGSNLHFSHTRPRTMLAKSPPTKAARWRTCVGATRSNRAAVAAGSVRSPSFDPAKTKVQPGIGSAATTSSTARPTRPVPPVTRTTARGESAGRGGAMMRIGPAIGASGGGREWDCCIARPRHSFARAAMRLPTRPRLPARAPPPPRRPAVPRPPRAAPTAGAPAPPPTRPGPADDAWAPGAPMTPFMAVCGALARAGEERKGVMRPPTPPPRPAPWSGPRRVPGARPPPPL